MKMKEYTKDSKIVNPQKNSDIKKPEEKTILIVDDESAIRTSLSMILGRSGYKVDTAENGAIALDKIKERNYSIVILDYKMPLMDGYETLKNIVAYCDKNKIHAPATIIMTAYNYEEIEPKCRQLGAFVFLSKPFKLQNMIDAVKSAEESIILD